MYIINISRCASCPIGCPVPTSIGFHVPPQYYVYEYTMLTQRSKPLDHKSHTPSPETDQGLVPSVCTIPTQGPS